MRGSQDGGGVPRPASQSHGGRGGGHHERDHAQTEPVVAGYPGEEPAGSHRAVQEARERGQRLLAAAVLPHKRARQGEASRSDARRPEGSSGPAPEPGVGGRPRVRHRDGISFSASSHSTVRRARTS